MVELGPAPAGVPHRTTVVGPDPVITRSESGRLSIAWPNGRGRSVEASVELVEQAVEQINALHRVAQDQAKDATEQRERADMAVARAAVSEDDAQRLERLQGAAESDAAAFRAALQDLAAAVDREDHAATAVALQAATEVLARG